MGLGLGLGLGFGLGSGLGLGLGFGLGRVRLVALVEGREEGRAVREGGGDGEGLVDQAEDGSEEDELTWGGWGED